MIELNYFFETPDGDKFTYQLIQFTNGGSWSTLDGDEFLGSIEKRAGKWEAVLGECLPPEMIKGAGKLIDRQNYHILSAEICNRWPKLIAEVIAKSDCEFMLICKPAVNFEAFERIFSKYVSGMIKDEWPIDFHIYNHDFSEDFILKSVSRVEELPNEPMIRWKC
ncbi:hypothetical protein ASE74_16670 [Pedobacter sp. Leaf216]|uniref:hypothetical protein n=1 Tax=Pedobacter sp. Leaf216 TaxID=1735684 RepID=UPI0006FBA9AC|nr:hypothetical protein [Pedobacter sp. Leaf216]KQM76908.1 hypothetical protein ASE74_16670 [Pedobacter sp. Leaf216]